MIIYQLTNTVNGKRYIGQTIHSLKSRLRQHKHVKHATYISKAIYKYGFDAFNVKVLLIVQDKEELDYYEQQLIGALNTLIPVGYNLRPGGQSPIGWNHTDEAKEKIRLAGQRPCADETKEKIRQKALGRKHTKEAKQKCAYWLGKKFTDAHKAKLGSGNRGKPRTEETKRRMSAAKRMWWKNRKRSIENGEEKITV